MSSLASSADHTAPRAVIAAARIPSEPLRSRALRAGGWLLGSSFASQALRLASSLVLTRLLVPGDFGLVAAVQTLYFALVMFSDLGVWQSVVNRRGEIDERFLGTAMSVQLARGALLAVVVLALAFALHATAVQDAFAAGTAFADPRMPWMMAAFAVCALLQGAESMRIATAQRALRAALLVRMELLSQCAGMVVTIALALYTRSVWSLVAGTLVATLARTALSHAMLPGPTVRPAWNAEAAHEIVGFGKWVFLSSIVGFAAAHGEKLLLGGTLPAASFGVFAIAATLLAAATGLIGNLNGHLVFPALAEALRTDDGRAAQVYQRVQRLADVVLAFSAGAAFMAASWLVRLLYDARYVDAGWMLQIIALGLLAMRFQVLEQMMFARGRPAWVTAANALRAAALVVSIPAGYTLAGERGAVIAVAASQFAGWPMAFVFRRSAGLPGWRAEAVWPVALVAGIVAGGAADHLLGAALGR